MGAEKNHLWPRSRYSPPRPPACTGMATVVLARTSEPPCFSVMPMPSHIDALSATGRSRGSYSWLNSLPCSYCHSAGSFCSSGMAAVVMVAGHSVPCSTWPCR